MPSEFPPLIPGYPSTYTSTQDKKHNRCQRFSLKNGLIFEKDFVSKYSGVKCADRILGKDAFKECSEPVLTFNSFYPVEANDTLGRSGYRKCKVLYFLSDDEIKVYEPRQENSGLVQGCIVNKAKHYKPDGDYYTIDDLNVGETLILNGREFKLIDCDGFTRKFLTETGYKVKSPEPDIVDPITEDRLEENIPRPCRLPLGKRQKYKSFFKHHPKQLRFFGYYCEGNMLFEEKRECTLYYDLASGTIKIVEERSLSKWIDGRRDTRVILRPTLVPKMMKPVYDIGDAREPTLLNHAHDIQNVLIGGKYYKIQKPTSYIADSNPASRRNNAADYYTDRDLELGVSIPIFGSEVFLYDCDEFTRDYYRTTYEKELTPVPRPDIKPCRTHKLVCPHEVFGEAEQTLRTNDPFPPIRYMTDLKRFFLNDKYGYNVRELKFVARMLTDDPVERSRNCLVRWFMEDDTMEVRLLNFDSSNVFEHRCIRRMRVVKPRSFIGNYERTYYQPQDMYVGNIIYVRGKAYRLIEADEYTYDYMERNCHIFVHSNIKAIMFGLKPWAKDNYSELIGKFQEIDRENCGYVTYEQFRDALYSIMTDENTSQYPEHAIKTLSRHYSEEKYIGMKMDDLTARIRTDLYRKKFYDFDELKLAMEIQDEGRTGYLEPTRVYYSMRSTSVPVNRDLMKSFIFKFPKTGGKIRYADIIDLMDWQKNSQQHEKVVPSLIDINWQHIENEKDATKIKYKAFLMNILD